jgi:hypothetical protein
MCESIEVGDFEDPYQPKKFSTAEEAVAEVLAQVEKGQTLMQVRVQNSRKDSVRNLLMKTRNLVVTETQEGWFLIRPRK